MPEETFPESVGFFYLWDKESTGSIWKWEAYLKKMARDWMNLFKEEQSDLWVEPGQS